MKARTVILVDDEPSVLRMLKQVIDWDSLGLIVCAECRNGKDALEKIQSLTPDLVLTDIRMPFITGLEIVEHCLRVMEKKPEFIVLSGYGDFELVRSAFRLGVRDYALKPIDPQELSDLLTKYAPGKQRPNTAMVSVGPSDQLGSNVEKVVGFINQHFSESISLKSLGDKFLLNPVYLGQMLKKRLGMYFGNYLQSLRIEEAKWLLTSTDLKIHAIAEEVGYHDKDYFTIKFEETTGMTPSDYRRNSST